MKCNIFCVAIMNIINKVFTLILSISLYKHIYNIYSI